MSHLWRATGPLQRVDVRLGWLVGGYTPLLHDVLLLVVLVLYDGISLKGIVMTKSRGIGRGGVRAGAFGRAAGAETLGADVRVSACVSEDDAAWLLTLDTNMSAAIRKAIMMARSPAQNMKSVSKPAGAKRPFKPEVFNPYFADGRMKALHVRIREEAEIAERNRIALIAHNRG